MLRRIVILALALGFLAGPSLASVATDGCPPCCTASVDAPCETDAGSCAALATVPCCDAPPTAPATDSRRSDAPVFPQLVSTARDADRPSFRPVAAPPADLFRLTSPLRLSVVLRI